MNFIIRETTIAEMESPEAVAVQEIHREELATHKHLMKLAPDMETYAKLLEKGILLPLIATYNEKIIGYSINIIEPNSHYKALIGCKNDMIYVLP